MKRTGQRQEIYRAAICMALIYAAFIAYLTVSQNRFIYIIDPRTPDRQRSDAADMAIVTVRTADGLTLSGWYAPPADPAKPVIVFFHGNAGNIGAFAPRHRPFVAAGYGFLLAEYRGFGGNQGQPSEKGLYTDARAWLDFVLAQGVPPDDIVLVGQSLGTGIAAQMALERPRSMALVLESPFTSLGAVAQNHLWYVYVAPLLRDRFDTLSKIGKIHMPLLIIHGQQDALVPYQEGLTVFTAANQPKTLIKPPNGTHLNLVSLGDGKWILTFIQSLKTR